MIIESPVTTLTIDTCITTNDSCAGVPYPTTCDMTTILTVGACVSHCIAVVLYSFFESGLDFFEFLQSLSAWGNRFPKVLQKLQMCLYHCPEV